MKLRKGMWVVADDGQVGIINAMRDGKAEFHRVGAEGLTEIVLLLDPSTLVQARYREIPESRRPRREVAAALGYQ